MNVLPLKTARHEVIDIAKRTLALHCIVARSHGVDGSTLTEWLDQENLTPELTARESRFLAAVEPTEAEVSWMTWMVEAQAMLLLALGKIQFDPLESKPCPVGAVVESIPELMTTTQSFLYSADSVDYAKLKQIEEEIYDIRVRVKDEVEGEFPLKSLFFFRHYALEWLLDDKGVEWDRVQPDI